MASPNQRRRVVGTREDSCELVLVEPGDPARWDRWQQATDAWLAAHRRRSGRDGTHATYRIAARQFFSWSDRNPWEVTVAVADAWATNLAEERGLASSTVNLKLAALTSLYDYARTISLWPADRINPFRAVDRTPVDSYGRATFPTVEELQRLLATINRETLSGTRDFALLYSFAFTCRRASEWLEIRWGDIHREPDGNGNRTYSYTVRKKGGPQRRRAVLDLHVYEAIVAYLRAANRLNGRRALGQDAPIWAPLWPARALRVNPDLTLADVASTPISNRTANGILKKWARRAGIAEEKAHLHALRHAGARLRVQQMRERDGGVDYEEIMRLLEHSSLAITQIYTQSICEEPQDPGGRDAAKALLPNG